MDRSNNLAISFYTKLTEDMATALDGELEGSGYIQRGGKNYDEGHVTLFDGEFPDGTLEVAHGMIDQLKLMGWTFTWDTAKDERL